MEISSSSTAVSFFFIRFMIKAIFEYLFTVAFSNVSAAVGEAKDGSDSDIELQHNDDMSVLMCRLLGGYDAMICLFVSNQ